MPKNIVVFSDGTGQDGGMRPEQTVSNVYKMYRACCTGPANAIDPKDQVAFYDPGLGTDIGATAMTSPMRFVQKLLASVTGRGITINIADCYTFIINHYQPGDRIILIGFSRGAYTVRCVANLLMLCGIPTRTPAGAVPLYRKAARDIAEEAVDTVLEHGAGHPRAEFEAERDELARRFRAKYASDHESGEPGRSNAAPHFIGVFDTVAALGATGTRRFLILAGFIIAPLVAAAILALPLAGLAHAALGHPFWLDFAVVFALGGAGLLLRFLAQQRRDYRKTIRDFPKPGDVHSHWAEWKGENFDRLLSRFVSFARSANAIDETRADFDRVGWGGTQPGVPMQVAGLDRLVQLWFAGNHSDIGGSYDETESRLSDIALQWMVEQATGVPGGLIMAGLKAPGDATENPRLRLFPASDGVQHDEVSALRDEIDARTPRFLLRFAGPLYWATRDRHINPMAPVHPTVRERFALPWVAQSAGSGPYRPSALAEHQEFKHYYAPSLATEAAPSA